MERQLAFHILQIEETKQEETIQEAYRSLLKQNNPEDNPEGFKRLREAYEVALNFARMEEDKEEEKEKTEIDLWIDEIDNVYQNIIDRNCLELWEELFKNPLCEDLDTSLEAREALLAYLMDHIYLPTKVWRLMEKTFQIVEDREHLEQKFPSNFLDYVVHYIENEQFMEYSMFKILDEEALEPNIDADGYIQNYLNIKRSIDRKEIKEVDKLEECKKQLEDLQAFGLYHPYENVEFLRLSCETIINTKEEYFAQFSKEELEQMDIWNEVPKLFEYCTKVKQFIQLLLTECRTDRYILQVCGYANWVMECYDEASQLFETLLEQYPNDYMGNFYQADCLFKKKEYIQAKKYVEHILQAGDDEATEELAHEINDELIQYYEELIQTKYNENFETSIELGWCYLQNDEFKKAISVLENLSPSKKQEHDYFNLYSRALYQDKQFEKAIPYLKRYFEILSEKLVDSEEKNQTKRSRSFRTLSILSECYYELKDMEQAIFYAKEAEQMINSLNDYIFIQLDKAKIYLEMEEYETCIDICDQIVEKDNQCYLAYLYRQKAAFKIYNGQQVVDDYYNMISIFNSYHEPYLLAAQVFFFYDQYEDAKGVFERARENEVNFSDSMKLYEAKVLKALAQEKQEMEKIIEIIDSISVDMENPDTDIEDVSEIYYEKALCYWYMDNVEEALKYNKLAIEQNKDRMQYRMFASDVYIELENYEEALKELDIAKEDYKEDALLYFNFGRCYWYMDRDEEALEYFEKTLEYQDGFRNVLYLISDYYRRRYNKKADKEDYKKAIFYITRHLEFQQNAYYYIERGRIHLGAKQLEEAMEDFRAALELDTENCFAYNNIALCYQEMEEYEKAISCFKQAVKCMKKGRYTPTTAIYNNLAACYDVLGEYRKAITCYKENLKLFPNEKSLYKKIASEYNDLNEHDKAIEYYNKYKEDKDYYSNLAFVYFCQGKKELALKTYEEGIRKADKEHKAEQMVELAYYYRDNVREYEKALASYQQALEIETDNDSLFNIRCYIIITLLDMGEKELAKKYAKEALEYFEKANKGTKENYLNFPKYRPARLALFAWISIGLGEVEKGLQMFHDMLACPRCSQCSHKKCFEAYWYLGKYYEAIGEYEKALDYYEKSYAINECSMTLEVSIEETKKKLNG